MQQAFKSAVTAVCFLPFGPFVCAGSLDKAVNVFHILTGEQRFALSAHSAGITALSVSHDGVLVSSSSDGDLRIWDLRLPWCVNLVMYLCECVFPGRHLMPTCRPEEMGTLLSCCSGGHTQAVTDCSLTEDGNALISASADTTLILWDALKGIALRYFCGHTGPITGLCLLDFKAGSSASEATTRASRITGRLRYFVSGSQDGSVRVWDVATGVDQCLLRLGPPLTCLAKSRDDSTIALGDVSGRLHLLSLRLPALPADPASRSASHEDDADGLGEPDAAVSAGGGGQSDYESGDPAD